MLTRMVVSVHSEYLGIPRSRTVLLSRSGIIACAQYLNSLDEPKFAGDGLAAFKSQINVPFSG